LSTNEKETIGNPISKCISIDRRIYMEGNKRLSADINKNIRLLKDALPIKKL